MKQGESLVLRAVDVNASTSRAPVRHSSRCCKSLPTCAHQHVNLTQSTLHPTRHFHCHHTQCVSLTNTHVHCATRYPPPSLSTHTTTTTKHLKSNSLEPGSRHAASKLLASAAASILASALHQHVLQGGPAIRPVPLLASGIEGGGNACWVVCVCVFGGEGCVCMWGVCRWWCV